MSHNNFPILLLLFAFSFVHSNAEVFSAIKELEKLAEIDKLMVGTIKSLSPHLNHHYVNKKVSEWEEERKLVEEDVTKYITNPLNAFAMIKRTTVDISIIDEMFPKIPSKFFNKLRNVLPNHDDLVGAVEGLLRLQWIYHMKTSDVAKGMILNKKVRKELSAHELFIIADEGRKLPEQEYFAQEYMRLALDKIMLRDFSPNELDELSVADVLASMYNYTNDYKNVLWIANTMLKKYPENPEFLEIRKKVMADDEKYGTTKLWLKSPFSEKIKVEGKHTREKERILYSQVCRGKVAKTPEEQAQLKCRYRTTSAFTKLARVKVEEANLDPYIVLLVDVVSDSEIKELINLFKPNMQRALTLTNDMKKVPSKNRTAQVATFPREDQEILKKLAIRTEDMTGLSQTTSETLQVQNYGIGGHYIPHWDHQVQGVKPFADFGNRIATVLFYLSDVEEGGATVFPYLKLKINPRKGSAAFWFNLQPSGEGESRTKHAACPVLIGSKWVANKWIREHGNEFRRPCPADLDFVEDDFSSYYKGFF